MQKFRFMSVLIFLGTACTPASLRSTPEFTPTLDPFSIPALGIWRSTGSLTIAHNEFTATLLLNGKVLVVGGLSEGQTNSSLDWRMTSNAELYDPATGTWSSAGTLSNPRQFHTATLLLNGKVLIVGGSERGSSTSVELYDPTTNSWTITTSLSIPRWEHTATLLPDSKVLVVGGANTTGSIASAELYDPVNGTWKTTGSLSIPRFGHTATLLSNGQVLVAGGAGVSAELYDSITGVWEPISSMHVVRDNLPTATLLLNGLVLVVGGNREGIASAEIFDPATSTWNMTSNMASNTIRNLHTATLLLDGKVLVVGGAGVVTPKEYIALASAEVYNPLTDQWSLTSNLKTARALHTATLLSDGQVLVAGGFNGQVLLNTAELYIPTSSNTH